MTINITNGDCLELMKNLPDKSVDLFICDLPYGETNCKWDSVIDLEEFWKEFKRLRKSKRTACIHFCSTKFGYTLIKSNEKMFKMDMIWKKRNKTGGLQSRHRPMRNHEMVYFFYEQAPQYNRDKYHKRIQPKKEHNIEKEDLTMGTTHKMKDTMHKCFEPPNPASVIEENAESNKVWGYDKPDTFKIDKNGTNQNFKPALPVSVLEEKFCKEYYETNKTGMTKTDIYSKEQIKKYHKENGVGFEPPNPASVLEETDVYGETKEQRKKRREKGDSSFEPPNPSSVVEEKPLYKTSKYTENVKKGYGYETGPGIQKDKKGDARFPLTFDPPNPASVLEETEDVWGQSKFSCGGDCGRLNEDGSYKLGYEPPNPASVYESTKVFIGKRHHQTEKPQDILEFFIKYWSDEGHTILDPTMGSGSTGVACKTLKRNFIGYEKDEKIFKVAENRIKKVEVII